MKKLMRFLPGTLGTASCVVCVFVSFLILLALGAHPTMGGGAPLWTSEAELLYSDLVVYGVMEEFKLEEVPIQFYMPTPVEHTMRIQITNIRLNILELLKGNWKQKYLWVVVPGGYPGSGPNVGITYNYTLGDTVVMSFIFNESMKGGRYMIRDDRGRFIFRNGVGICQYWNCNNLTLEQIKGILKKTSISYMTPEADLIGTGTVISIGTAPEYAGVRSRSEVKAVSMVVDTLIKGHCAEDTLTFRMIWGGFYRPWWWASVPKIRPGEKWFFFLKKADFGYYPFAGSNGLLRIQDDKLIYNNRVEYWLSKPALLQECLLEVKRHED